jgi:hypothetical protein
MGGGALTNKLFMITKIDVTGPEAFAYFEDHLTMGGKTLSDYLSAMSWREGKIYAVVPQNTKPELLFQFESGGIYPYEAPRAENNLMVAIQNDARPVVVDWIDEYLGGIDHCCIFEESSRALGGGWVKESKMEYVSIGKEMYYYFDGENRSKEKIRDALRWSGSYYFLCVLGRLGAESRAAFLPKQEISPLILEELSQQVEAIIVQAYDYEGYLMWERG